MKKFLTLLLITPVLLCCKEDPVDPFSGEAYKDAAPMVKDGSTVLATNPNVEKFLTEVTYQDKDWASTKIYDYYGGINGKYYDENGNPLAEDKGGKLVKAPKSDKPCSYSIRWAENPEAGEMTFHLEEGDWKMDKAVKAGACYVNFNNLVPNASYTYSVTATDGTVITSGSFKTTGHLHQVFFSTGCRNGRDLGGWKTVDGKTVKYHKVYRGGRMQTETLDGPGKREVLAEGIRAQLDLRGESDVLSAPAIEELDFCAPVIESGGSTMLEQDGGIKTKQCFEFVVNSLRNNKPVYFHCSLGRDRTGTLAIVLLGVLGVPEADISKEYELTYFAPKGYSIAYSEDYTTFQNNRTKWVYQPTAQFFWGKAGSGTFASGVEKYLLEIGVSQQDIDDFRTMMLE